MKTLHLIDASIYIFRAYFSIPDTMTGVDDMPVNAVYGFADFLHQFNQASRARHVVVAFDESLTSSFRNEIYPPYKANRELPPPELEAQLKACRELTDILGFKTYASNRFEADDLIGTAARQMRGRGFRMVYVTGDKDLAQLLEPGDVWWNFARNENLGFSEIQNKLGVRAQQVVDLLALMGDAVDNIPGVPGVGHKTASALLSEFDTLDDVYAGLHQVSGLPLRGAARVRHQLEQHRESAFLSQELARINKNAPIRCTEASVSRKAVRPKRLEAFCVRHNFSERMTRRLLSI
jgi:DNA polymerase-1